MSILRLGTGAALKAAKRIAKAKATAKPKAKAKSPKNTYGKVTSATAKAIGKNSTTRGALAKLKAKAKKTAIRPAKKTKRKK
jgi:hypothetical protein